MSSSSRQLVVVIVLTILALVVGGAWFYRDQQQHVREDVEKGLQAIAELKVGQIADWRSEHLRDAAMVTESPFFADAVAGWILQDPQAGIAEKLISSLRSMQEHYQYRDVTVVDSKGQVRLSLSNSLGSLHDEAEHSVTVALKERRPVLTGLHVGPADLPPHVDLIAPLFSSDGKIGSPVGAVVFQIDARQFLYPLIQSWPTPSRSAETLLVRRDGDAVLYLNELRHTRDTELKLRIPLSREDVPAVMTVLGREGVVRGTDYRGVDVLSVLKAIPNSPWFMVAKMDAKEAFADWQRRSFLIMAFFLAVITSLMAAVGVVWQAKAKGNYRTLYETEAALRRSEEGYRITLMSVGDGIIVTDHEGRVEMLNPVAEVLTGWSRQEAHGRPLEEVFPIVNEETRQAVENPVARVLAEGTVVGLANHTVLIARNGNESPVADSCAPIHDENGVITGTVLVFRDQTDERAKQKKLSESVASLKRSQAIAHLGSWELDLVNNVLTWSDEVYRIFGLQPQEFMATYEGFLQAVHPDDHEAVNEAYSGSLREGRDVYEIEHRVVCKSTGEIRYVHEKCSHVRDELGNIIRSTGMVHDITERKQAEEALREAKDNLEVRVKERTAELEKAKETVTAERQRLNDVMETLPAYLVLLTPDYHVMFANRFFRERFGESNGRRCFEYLFNRTEPCEICDTYTVLKTMAPHRWEWTGPDGRNYDVHDFPFTDADGSPLILEMGIDVTERKQAEDALKQTLADLTSSNADLEHFAYVASHDLQEPLRSVASALQMLEKKHKGRLGKDSDQLIHYAVDSAKKMKALISDLLIYSRLSTRGQPFRKVNVQEVLSQTILNLKNLIEENEVEITFDQLPTVRADSIQLLQVFQNLIGNAVKFGPAESARVHVSAQEQGSEWIFSVQDNGIGIKSEYFDRIFVIFQQLNKKGSFHGTGMGLAIVKKIVERHRGRVWVESEVGMGSKFYFTIPDGASA